MGTRAAKEYEIFVKRNPDVFQPIYDAECASKGVSGRGKLPVWHKIAKELWDEATEEQKLEVHEEIAAMKVDTEVDEADPSTPEEYQKRVFLLCSSIVVFFILGVSGIGKSYLQF